MFIDAKTLNENEEINCQLCIIGAGVAGIILARELSKTLTDIVLLESGGLALEAKTQALYEGDSVGHPHYTTDADRLRYFGGTSNHWAGQCRPLDPIDFEARPWVGGLGWPFGRKQLEPYYQKVQPLFDLGSGHYDDINHLANKLDFPTLELDQKRLKSAVFNQSPPTRFGLKYQQELKENSRVRVVLNANVLQLNPDPKKQKIDQLDVAVLDGAQFKVSAKIFILATGGMENPRLMLLSERANPGKMSWNSSLVGRYFMDHLILRPAAEVSLSQKEYNLGLYSQAHKLDDGAYFAVMAASRELMEREKLPNFRMNILGSRIQHFHYNIGTVTDTIDSFIREQHELNAQQTAKDYGVLALHLGIEPIPNPDSRVRLGTKLDALGQPQIELDWKVDPKDLHTAYRATELAGLEFGRLGLGRIFSEFIPLKEKWPNKLKGGFHHCGTTRMAESPELGVVDANCKAHGVQNLFIAGSSVFPTIGYANPTLTIAAMAVRMSEHILQEYNAYSA